MYSLKQLNIICVIALLLNACATNFLPISASKSVEKSGDEGLGSNIHNNIYSDMFIEILNTHAYSEDILDIDKIDNVLKSKVQISGASVDASALADALVEESTTPGGETAPETYSVAALHNSVPRKALTGDGRFKPFVCSKETSLKPLGQVVSVKLTEDLCQVDDVWEAIRKGFSLDHQIDNPRVQAELRWFIKHPDYMKRVVERAEPHLYFILKEVKERGLPTELALLPIVESAYDPFAYSPGRASGLWQFIPSTAKMFNIKMDWWSDSRRDVKVSTYAALEYLNRLNRSFKGDWMLALASYNSGAGNIRAAIRKNKRKGKATDYWSLRLFRETTAYVPRLLAISELLSDPDKYGLELKSVANSPYWTEVDTGGQLDLARAAELADITPEEIYLLNPGFNQWSTRPEGPHELLVPLEKAALFETRLASLQPEDRLRWVLHRVNKGESLSLLAQHNRTSVESIRRINKLEGNLIHVGNSLMIPSPSFSKAASDGKERLSSYQRGDKDQGSQEYIVQNGDTFWHLGQKFGVSHRSLANWNGMSASDTLVTGAKLVIHSSSNTNALPEKPEVIRRVNYRVRNGESLALIANKFNLSVGKIKKWNNKILQTRYIQPGQRLTLYVDVTQTE